ncbi:hypothetical protein EDD15DRAFT_2289284 [Pisolithus albus]|nr:hypothetical protein EDD15DRAFT_2289284 [Pisolithus albus]
MGLFDWFRGSKETSTILPTDTVVFIVGPTGSGKSWFMSNLLKKANIHVSVSKSLRPGTKKVHAERCQFEGLESDIVIVDTPSFYTCTKSDGEKVVRKWMESNHTQPCRVAKMVYMHDLASNPHDENLRMLVHLDAFRRAYLPNPFPRVIHVVPTVGEGARLPKEKIGALTAQLQHQASAVGARLHTVFNGEPFDGTPETAWDIVQGLLNVRENGRQG